MLTAQQYRKRREQAAERKASASRKKARTDLNSSTSYVVEHVTRTASTRHTTQVLIDPLKIPRVSPQEDSRAPSPELKQSQVYIKHSINRVVFLIIQ